MSEDKEKRYKWVYFDITGEFLLDLLKQRADLPDDIKLVRVTEAHVGYQPHAGQVNNIMRFIVSSESYPGLYEGSSIPGGGGLVIKK